MLRALVCLVLTVSCFAAGPAFDAASVKVTGPEVHQPYLITGGPGTNDPGRFRAPHISMTTLLQRAFGISTDQFKGPAVQQAFSAGVFFDVTATMPPDTTKEQFQLMLQNLLIERFHLVFHKETANFPGYDLVVDKGGPKFKEVFPDPAAAANPSPGAAGISISTSIGRSPDNFPDFPQVTGPRTMNQVANGKERTKYQERTMAEFVSNLGYVIGSSMGKPVTQGYPQARVVDKTGLTGKYTFILEYSSEAGAAFRNLAIPGQGNPEAPGAAPAVANDPGGGAPNIIVAIQKQLGLRLDKTADNSLEVVVVDSVDKTPTEN